MSKSAKLLKSMVIAACMVMPMTATHAGVHTLEAAFKGKIPASAVEPAYQGEIGALDQGSNPWVAVTQGKWARETDPSIRQQSYALEARADYDADGAADTARLYTNGRQLAVIVRFASGNKAPMVIYKTDTVVAGMEVYGGGNRFVLNVPEIGYRVLLMSNGKPGVFYMGD